MKSNGARKRSGCNDAKKRKQRQMVDASLFARRSFVHMLRACPPRRFTFPTIQSAPIHVVTAAIVNERDKRLFMQRRSGTTRYPGTGERRAVCCSRTNLWQGLFRRARRGARTKHLRRFPFDYVYCHDEPSIVTGQITRVRCLYVSSEAVVGPYQVLADAVAGFDWVTAEELEG